MNLETMEQKNARNARVSAQYDDLMDEGKHGHYETMFRIVRIEVELAVAAERERWEKAVCKALDLCDRLQTKKALDMLADMVKSRME